MLFTTSPPSIVRVAPIRIPKFIACAPQLFCNIAPSPKTIEVLLPAATKLPVATTPLFSFPRPNLGLISPVQTAPPSTVTFFKVKLALFSDPVDAGTVAVTLIIVPVKPLPLDNLNPLPLIVVILSTLSVSDNSISSPNAIFVLPFAIASFKSSSSNT